MFRLKNVLYANFLVLATELAGTPFTNIELLEKNINFLFFLKFIYYFIFIFGCVGSLLLRGGFL